MLFKYHTSICFYKPPPLPNYQFHVMFVGELRCLFPLALFLQICRSQTMPIFGFSMYTGLLMTLLSVFVLFQSSSSVSGFRRGKTYFAYFLSLVIFTK